MAAGKAANDGSAVRQTRMPTILLVYMPLLGGHFHIVERVPHQYVTCRYFRRDTFWEGGVLGFCGRLPRVGRCGQIRLSRRTSDSATT